MRIVLTLAVIAALASVAVGEVWTTVYRCDETTPLPLIDSDRPGVYQDIMVGTRLVIVVSSDTGGCWWGQLRLFWDGAQYASLGGRGPTIVPGLVGPEYRDSCLEAAGDRASVWDFGGPEGVGFEFSTSHDLGVPDRRLAVPGEWFIFDYEAQRAGSCDVGLYDLFISLYTPIEQLSFTHVPSRDFDGDTIINFEDLVLLARHWRATVGHDPNGPETVLDLNSDGRVDTDDLTLFSEHWLERTDCGEVAIAALSEPEAVSTNSREECKI